MHMLMVRYTFAVTKERIIILCNVLASNPRAGILRAAHNICSRLNCLWLKLALTDQECFGSLKQHDGWPLSSSSRTKV